MKKSSRKLLSLLLGAGVIATSVGLASQPALSDGPPTITSLEYKPNTTRFNESYSFEVNGSTSTSISLSNTVFCDVYRVTNLESGAVRYQTMEGDGTGPGPVWSGRAPAVYTERISISELFEYKLFQGVGCGGRTPQQVFDTNNGGDPFVSFSRFYLKDSAAIPVTPQQPPTVIALDGKVLVSWSAVPDATSYTVTRNPDGEGCSVAAPATSCEIAGLTNGTAYTFSLSAGNVIGSSAFSLASEEATPAPTVAPNAPTDVTATAGNASASLSWTAPTTGTVPFTYSVTSDPTGATCTFSGTTANCTGLTNGTSYTFTVTATNAAGEEGTASAASNSVTPAVPVPPGAPTIATVVPGNGSVTVTWTAPTTGGSPTSYTVTASPGGATCSAAAPATSCTVGGLANGTSYTFVVRASNTAGTSLASTASSSVTPSGAGGAPGGQSGSTPAVLLSTPNASPNSNGVVSLNGTGFELVTEAFIADRPLSIINKSSSGLTFQMPGGFAAGTYDLVLSGSFGTLTLQGAIVIRATTALEDTQGLRPRAFTKAQSDGTVKVYARDAVGLGKIQFKINGREIAWIRALDATDPRINLRGDGMVRTVKLMPGKNAIEIFIEGVRVWRAAYTGR
jgi:hypothetical protein